MKTILKILSLSLVFAMVTKCIQPGDVLSAPKGYVKSLTISSKTLTISVGKSKALSYEVKVKGNVSKNITVKASNANVKVTIKNGKIKLFAEKAGNCTVIISTKGKSKEGKNIRKTITVKTIKAAHKVSAGSSQAARKAYAEILLKKKLLNESGNEYSTHFTICDLNADGTPELILGTSGSSVRDATAYYTYQDGKAVKLKISTELFPVYGTLYTIPSRGTFAFTRGGPAYDDDKGNGCMPYTVREYKLVGRKIKLANEVNRIKYEFGKRAGENEYQLNGEQCTAEEFQMIYNVLGKEIKLVPNSAKKRKKMGVSGR